MGGMNGAVNGAEAEKEPLEKPMAAADEAATDPAVAPEKQEAAAGQDEVKEEATEAKKGKGKEAKAKTPAVPLWKLYSRADSIDVLLMILGTLGAVCLGAAMPCLSLLFGQLTNSFGQNTGNPEGISEAVTTVALRFLWVGIGAAFAAYLEVTCWMLTGERQADRLRSQFLAAILRQEIAYFDKSTNTGAVIGHMSGDILTIQEAMGEKVGTFLRFFATFLGGFAVAFASGWQLTLVMLAALPLLAVCGSLMTVVISRSTTRGQEAYSEAGSVVEECVGAIRTVLAFTGESRAVGQYNKRLDKAYAAGVQSSLATGLGIGATMLVMFSSYALALWYGSTLILNGTGYTGGTVMTVLFGVIIGGMSLGQAGPSFATLAQGQAAAYKIFEVLERKPEIDSGDLSGETLEAVRGEVGMQGVVFSYPSRPDVRIFDDFSLTIPAGQSVALVGESGSGKSTVISLIERFYDPQGGAVTLDGRDIRTLQVKWLREQLALVSQEPVLFHTTVRGNIAYGRSTPLGEDELIRACERANINSFIQSLPQGYDTEVGERGTQLSGGQKQRIAIARALVRDPRVLLLDEATSALDAESEKVVQRALDSIMGGRTTIIVAHRLSTVRKADMIAVMQRGRVVETGKHSTLIADPTSAYYQLVHLQESHMRGTDTEEANAAGQEDAPGVSGTVEAAETTNGHVDAPPPDALTQGETAEASGAAAAAVAPSEALAEEAIAGGGLPGLPLPLSTNGLAAAAHPEAASGEAAGTGVGGAEGSGDLEKGEAQKSVEVKRHASFGGAAAKSLRRRLSTKKGAGSKKGDAGKEGVEEAEAEEEEPKGPDVPLSRVLPLNKPEWPLALLAMLAAMGNGLMFPVFAILLSHIIPVFYEPDPAVLRSDANFWSIMFVVLAASVFVLMVAQNFLFGVIGSRLIRRVRRLCFSAVLRQEVAWFDQPKNSSGAIGARLSTDAAQVRAMVGDRLALVVQNLSTVCAGLIIAFVSCWQLSLVVLSTVPLLVFAGTMQMKALMGLSENAKVMFEEASRVANDAVGNIRTVAAFGSEDKVMQLYRAKCTMPLKAGARKALVSGFGMAFSQFVMFANYSLAFWYGGQLVEQGVTSFQNVFQVFFAIVMSAMGVAQSAGLAPDVVTVQTAVNSIFRILDRQSAIDPDAPGASLDAPQGVVELQDVHFAYPLRPDIKIFQGLTLTIPTGQTVALVGQSGSGKSTVVALVERFYDPLAGAVLLDGADIRKLQLKWLRQQLALVNQEPTLFNVSIRDNIMYGRDNASEAEVVEAAKAANAHTFVSALPDGYNTLVGERGVQLSGGQKQRIAIARAVLKDPRVLLLDEATSALDAESEAVVQEALERVMVGRTTIVIAHRLATVVNSDKIAVMQAGRVVEEGTHKQLLAMGGVYASLASLQ